jgi:hypothetical protein
MLKGELQELGQALEKVDLRRWRQACNTVVPTLSAFERDYLVAIMYERSHDLKLLNFQAHSFLSYLISSCWMISTRQAWNRRQGNATPFQFQTFSKTVSPSSQQLLLNRLRRFKNVPQMRMRTSTK